MHTMQRPKKSPLAKLLALTLTFAMLLGIAITAAAAPAYPDISGHWGETAIEKWSAYDVLHGNDLGTFDPDGELDVTQLAQILVNTFGYTESYTGTLPGYTSTWGEEAVRKAVAAGAIEAGEAALPLTRELAAKIVAKAFGIAPVSGASKFSDDYAISSEYKPYAAAVGRAGIFNGNDYGELMPADAFSRAQIMQALDNAVTDIVKENKAAESAKSVILNKGGVTLSEGTIEGDLIIAQGVGDGDITLDGVTVNGRLVIFGGGANSIHIKGKSSIANVTIAKTFGQAARFVVESADAVVGTVTIIAESKATVATTNGAEIAKIEVVPETEVSETGEVAAAEVTAATTVTISAKAAAVEIAAENAALTISSGATITSLTVETKATVAVASGATVTAATIEASDVKLSGAGKVTAVTVTEDAKTGVEVKTSGTKVTVDAGAGSVTTSTGKVDAGKTGTTSGTSSNTSNDSGIGSGSGTGTTTTYAVTAQLTYPTLTDETIDPTTGRGLIDNSDKNTTLGLTSPTGSFTILQSAVTASQGEGAFTRFFRFTKNGTPLVYGTDFDKVVLKSFGSETLGGANGIDIIGGAATSNTNGQGDYGCISTDGNWMRFGTTFADLQDGLWVKRAGRTAYQATYELYKGTTKIAEFKDDINPTITLAGPTDLLARPQTGTATYQIENAAYVNGGTTGTYAVKVKTHSGSAYGTAEWKTADTGIANIFAAVYEPNKDVADTTNKAISLFHITIGSANTADLIEVKGATIPQGTATAKQRIQIGVPDVTNTLPDFIIPPGELGAAQTTAYSHTILVVNKGAYLNIDSDQTITTASAKTGNFRGGNITVKSGGKLRDGAYSDWPLGADSTLVVETGGYLAVGPGDNQGVYHQRYSETEVTAEQDGYAAGMTGWLIGPQNDSKSRIQLGNTDYNSSEIWIAKGWVYLAEGSYAKVAQYANIYPYNVLVGQGSIVEIAADLDTLQSGTQARFYGSPVSVTSSTPEQATFAGSTVIIATSGKVSSVALGQSSGDISAAATYYCASGATSPLTASAAPWDSANTFVCTWSVVTPSATSDTSDE